MGDWHMARTTPEAIAAFEKSEVGQIGKRCEDAHKEDFSAYHICKNRAMVE